MLSKAGHHVGVESAPSVDEIVSRYTPRTLLGLRLSALVEITLFLGLTLLLDIVFLGGDRYLQVQPHPFWIIILLAAVQYGTSEGLLAAILSSVALLAWNLPPHPLEQNLYDYLLTAAKQPLMWMVAAVILGELRMRHLKERGELVKNLAGTSEREHIISEAYINLKRIKEKLETHMAGELRSSVNAYNAMKSLGTLNPSRTLLGVEEVVKAVMDPEKFSVYALGADGLESATCVGWKEEEPYSRRFPNTSAIYHEIVGRQRMLCCINDNEAKILGREGLIAAPLIDAETGKVFGMLKIEDIGFSKLTLSNVESFRILCEVAGLAHSNAEKYRQAELNSIINMENDLFSYMFFQQQCALLTQLANVAEFTPAVLSLRLMNVRQFSTKDKALLAEEIKRIIHERIHDVAQVFNGKKLGSEFHVLLPATSEDRLKFALGEIQEGLKAAEGTLLSKAHVTMASKLLGVNKDLVRQAAHET